MSDSHMEPVQIILSTNIILTMNDMKIALLIFLIEEIIMCEY